MLSTVNTMPLLRQTMTHSGSAALLRQATAARRRSLHRSGDLIPPEPLRPSDPKPTALLADDVVTTSALHQQRLIQTRSALSALLVLQKSPYHFCKSTRSPTLFTNN